MSGKKRLLNKEYPNFEFEKGLWKRDFQIVAGVDEVGRGCFAGPVVAGVVSFARNSSFQFPLINKKGEKVIINDSKKLSAGKRLIAYDWIKENAIAWGVGIGTVAEINRLGMSKATASAFRRAVSSANKRLSDRIDFLLIDAFYIPYVVGLRMPIIFARKRGKTPNASSRQMAIVKGDEKSITIAAASIIAKVYRDSLMVTIGTRPKYKKYGWVSNKGYGTKLHRDAIIRYGITGYHRKQFINTYLAKLNQ